MRYRGPCGGERRDISIEVEVGAFPERALSSTHSDVRNRRIVEITVIIEDEHNSGNSISSQPASDRSDFRDRCSERRVTQGHGEAVRWGTGRITGGEGETELKVARGDKVRPDDP